MDKSTIITMQCPKCTGFVYLDFDDFGNEIKCNNKECSMVIVAWIETEWIDKGE